VTSPLQRRAPGLRGAAVELTVVGFALAANLLARWLTLDDLDVALTHARSLLALEERLGLDWEHLAQGGIEGVPWLGAFASWFYVWGYLPVLALALVGLFVRRPGSYAFLRNALLAGGMVGLPVYVLWPLAPPRLTDLGYTDTVGATLVDGLARPVGLANEIGAMPSFHVGYLVVVSAVVWRLSGGLLVRAWCVLHPLLMAWVVLATGNHWVLDLPAGAALAVAGLAVARWVESPVAALPASRDVRPYEPLPRRPSVGRWRGGHDG
jgi:hypothetical protein